MKEKKEKGEADKMEKKNCIHQFAIKVENGFRCRCGALVDKPYGKTI